MCFGTENVPFHRTIYSWPSFLFMAWWNKIFGTSGQADGPVAYYDEGLALIAEDKVHEALTSFRLALKVSPGDVVVLQQIAIAYTRIGMTEEAEKTYRHVLQKDPQAAGAHYGLAFLLIRSGHESEAIPHLRAFLENAPAGQEASEHVSHARETLADLTEEAGQAERSEGLDPGPDEFL
jgi:tetratricopeptide (TPR) repeat protein